jgi:hypothetical protein
MLLGVMFAGRHIWRTKFKRGHLLGLASMIFPTPGRISLEPLPSCTAHPNARAEKRITAFHDLGFVRLATYRLSECDETRLHALAHPASGFVALVHEHPSIGTWSDVMRFSAAGESPVLVSNVLKHVYFRCLPGDPKFHHAGVPEAELVRIAESLRAHTGAAQFVDANTFPCLCESAYAEAADRQFHEWPSENELRRLIKDVSPECELGDRDITALRKLLPEWVANDWRTSCVHEFLHSGSVSAREWEQARDRLLVIHDHTPLRALGWGTCSDGFLTPEMRKCLRRARARMSCREEFARLNAELPASMRYKKMGSVAKPVPADIYRAPLPGGPG